MKSTLGFPAGSLVKNLPASAEATGGAGWIPGSGRSPEGGSGSQLQHSCLENPRDRGAWRATVHGAAELDTTEVAEHTAPAPKMGEFRLDERLVGNGVEGL